jgi:hypothetical protein
MTLTYDWWNVYHVAKIPDLDGDGAPEMVVATGGDIRNPPTVGQNHNAITQYLVSSMLLFLCAVKQLTLQTFCYLPYIKQLLLYMKSLKIPRG